VEALLGRSGRRLRSSRRLDGSRGKLTTNRLAVYGRWLLWRRRLACVSQRLLQVDRRVRERRVQLDEHLVELRDGLEGLSRSIEGVAELDQETGSLLFGQWRSGLASRYLHAVER
jgi:hypothetical protein